MVQTFREYLSDVTVALACATGTIDGIAGMAAHGRLPRIGDDTPPWRVRGWLLPHVMDLLPPDTRIGRGRWWYWLRCRENGHLPADPIPPVAFHNIEDGSRTAAGKMLARCVDIIDTKEGHWRGEATALLIEWLAYALHVSADQCRLKDDTQEALYRQGFCLDPLIAEPSDYFGWLLSECKGRGTDPRGFYPTPMCLVQLMAGMTFEGGPEDTADRRRMTVSDPCVGTGRMLLAASNWSMRLYGQDIDRRCVQATLINGALFAPWLSFPLPAACFGVPAPAPPVFDDNGQGMLPLHPHP